MIKMKQVPQIFALLVTVTTVFGPTVNSWPASVVPARHLNDTNRSDEQRTGGPRPIVAGMQSMNSIPQMSTNTNLQLHSNQKLAGETSMSNHPSSQTSEREFSMPPTDSIRPMATTKKTDSIQTNKQNFSGVNSRPNYPDFDSMSEGSGSGPQQIGKNGRFMKLDDTEDSGDDDGDNDEDYDYRDTLDSGSGLGQLKSTTTRRPEPVAKEAPGKAQLNDPYSPFRPSIVESDSIATTTTGTLIPPVMTTRPVVVVTTRAPLKMLSTTPPAPSTTTTFYPKISTSTTTSRNLVASANKYNETRAEADYDYEDENEDDDSADSSAFEDNEPSEMIAISKPAAKPQTNSSSNTQANRSNEKFYFAQKETATKLPVASSTDQTAPPKLPMATETPATEYGHRQTTSRPPTIQKMTSKPAITFPTVAPQPTRPGQSSHKFGDLDEEDEERVPEEEENEEEEEEEDEEEMDDDIVDNDRDEEEPILGLEPIRHSNGRSNATQHTKPILNSSPKYSTANLSTTRKPRLPTFSATLSPSQNRDDLANFQPSTTTQNPNVISATSFATNQISSVPIFSSTTASPTTTANVVVNNPLKPNEGASQPNFFAQPTRIPTVSSAYRPTLSSATDKPDSRVSTLSNPSNRPPPSQVTTTATNILHNGPPHENGDTLTKQIYAKALELYQEADKKVRAAWEAVWPPNLNFDSSAVEPLLNQPLFFMLALGGTVIGLVLLMMLVVYIITYQIQPKDDDSSIY